MRKSQVTKFSSVGCAMDPRFSSHPLGARLVRTSDVGDADDRDSPRTPGFAADLLLEVPEHRTRSPGPLDGGPGDRRGGRGASGTRIGHTLAPGRLLALPVPLGGVGRDGLVGLLAGPRRSAASAEVPSGACCATDPDREALTSVAPVSVPQALVVAITEMNAAAMPHRAAVEKLDMIVPFVCAGFLAGSTRTDGEAPSLIRRLWGGLDLRHHGGARRISRTGGCSPVRVAGVPGAHSSIARVVMTRAMLRW